MNITKKEIAFQIGGGRINRATVNDISLVAYYTYTVPVGLDNPNPTEVEWVLVRESFRAVNRSSLKSLICVRPNWHVLCKINQEDATLELSRPDHEKEEAVFRWSAYSKLI